MRSKFDLQYQLYIKASMYGNNLIVFCTYYPRKTFNKYWYRKKTSHLTKTGVPSSQSHWPLSALLMPRKTVMLLMFILSANCSILSCVKDDFGIIRFEAGLIAWHWLKASDLEAAFWMTATQPSWSNHSKPRGQTESLIWESFLVEIQRLIYCQNKQFLTLTTIGCKRQIFTSKKLEVHYFK